MCGVVGFWSHGRPEQTRAAVRDMIAASQHRGPDASGSVEIPLATSSLVLGHTRLSILDLSDASRQPMHDADSGFLAHLQRRDLQLPPVARGAGDAGREVLHLGRHRSSAAGAGAMGRSGARQTGRHVRLRLLGWPRAPSPARARSHGHQAALLLPCGTRLRLRFGSESARTRPHLSFDSGSRRDGFVPHLRRGDRAEHHLPRNPRT